MCSCGPGAIRGPPRERYAREVQCDGWAEPGGHRVSLAESLGGSIERASQLAMHRRTCGVWGLGKPSLGLS